MSTNSYNTLIAKRDKTEQDYWNYVHANQQLQEKIDRLKQAKHVVSDQQSDFANIRREVSRVTEEHYEWEGDNYGRFIVNHMYLTGCNNSYYNAIDDVLDAINNEITRLENQLHDNESHMHCLKILKLDLLDSIRKFGSLG